MATFQEDQNTIARARKAYQNAEQAFYRAKLNVQKEQRPQSLAEVNQALVRSQTAFDSARNQLSSAIATLYRNHAFTEAVASLDATIPVLLLPLRLETKFVTKGSATELLVRIYPDDIHIHSHGNGSSRNRN